MNAKERKLALSVARDLAVDLSGFDDGCLLGCGLPEFRAPITVELGVIAKLLRYQCLMFNGNWDWQEWENMDWIMRRKIRLAELSSADARGLVADVCGRVLAGGDK